MSKLLFKDNVWSIDTIHNMWDVIQEIATTKYNLTFYPPRFELIDYEGMLTAYSTVALPNLYDHWSFGKKYVEEYNRYKDTQNLAFEVVINSNPSICYLMDSNTATMQALVIAHAAVGHSSFFKNNYLFKTHTNASTIIETLAYMNNRIKQLEEIHGYDRVEGVLDWCHQLRYLSFEKFNKPYMSNADRSKLLESIQEGKDKRSDKILDYTGATYFQGKHKKINPFSTAEYESGDNVLAFLRDHSVNMEDWTRELLTMFLEINQYLFPQMQTQLMNEGYASFWHYTLMNDLYQEGYIGEGSYWEFMQVHAGVLSQPSIKDGNVGVNPYKLGFDMYQDIKRVSMTPTEEDKKYFPDWAGNGDWLATIKYASENYKDESFVMQYLSPKVIRDYKFVLIENDYNKRIMTVTQAHTPEYYESLAVEISKSYDFFSRIPEVKVMVDPLLREVLKYKVSMPHENMHLTEVSEEVLSSALEYLWAGEVKEIKKDAFSIY